MRRISATSDALLRRTPAGHRLVLACGPDPSASLERATRIRGTRDAVVARAWADPVAVRIGDDLPRFAGATRLFVCLEPAAGAVDALDPAVRDAVAGLLDGGVATKAAADALATLTGWPRRRAYAAALGLAGGSPSAPPES